MINIKNRYGKTILAAAILLASTLGFAQSGVSEISFKPGTGGIIPAWLVTGPVEFPLVGFGIAKDTVAINEPYISPAEGDYAVSMLPEKERTQWFLQSPDAKGFLDFKNSIEWNVNNAIPVKIWYARAGYAYTTIVSEVEKDVVLLLGSNLQTAVYLNGERKFTLDGERNAAQDQDTIKLRLKKGNNDLIVRVLNTHKNLGISYFGVIRWEWGFFARITDVKGSTPGGINYQLKTRNSKSDFEIASTFFFKKTDGALKQRIDLEVNSVYQEKNDAVLKIKTAKDNYEFRLAPLAFGKNRRSVYLPEIANDLTASAELLLAGELISKNIVLKKQKKYDIHLMMLSHTDVGYTHAQPVCEELHCNTLDDVVKYCREYADFNWTIETTWQLEAYERLRTKEKFLELISFIKSGRVAVSPVFTNPFTGYISEEEMLRSLDKAIEYKKEYGISYLGAVYNDVPGQAWFLPQVFSKAGIKFVAEGINEVYGDYKLQRNLPKVFKWESADGSRVVTYLNEAYNEGKSYGLESADLFCIEQRMWERINKLESKNYKPDVILINTSFADNGPVPITQYQIAMKWNGEYEYPKFVSSNVNKFTEALINSRAYNELPVLKGDWTSNWDIFYQGEFERHKDTRWIHHQMLTAEKISALSHLIDSSKSPMNREISDAYTSLLRFTGHGSGLEYGYGSPEDNKLTMAFRQNYVDAARLGTWSVLLRGMTQITKREESLESEAIYAFNPLSWGRSELAEIRFPFDNSPEYEIIDAGTGKTVPSFRKNHKQFFLTGEIASFGFKKFLMKPKQAQQIFESGLIAGENTIENKYYKITVDKSRSAVTSIIDKKTGKEIADVKSPFGIAEPTREYFQLNKTHAAYSNGKAVYKIIDERPVRLIIRVERENDVIEALEYSLIDNCDAVYLDATVNLAQLKTTKLMEEYALPFGFNIPGARIYSEILGGFIELDKDRLPGIDQDAVSLRRTAAVFNENENIIWANADSRVIRIRKNESGDKVVIYSNLVNNFPDDWNRHENQSGSIRFRYAFTSAKGGFDAGKTTRFGYELNTPVQLKKHWFASQPASGSFLEIDNKNVIMLNLKSTEAGAVIRIINADSKNSQAASIKSPLFKNVKASIIDLYGNVTQKLFTGNNGIEVKLKPGEFTDILIN